jgi:hypothetical protein
MDLQYELQPEGGGNQAGQKDNGSKGKNPEIRCNQLRYDGRQLFPEEKEDNGNCGKTDDKTKQGTN